MEYGEFLRYFREEWWIFFRALFFPHNNPLVCVCVGRIQFRLIKEGNNAKRNHSVQMLEKGHCGTFILWNQNLTKAGTILLIEIDFRCPVSKFKYYHQTSRQVWYYCNFGQEWLLSRSSFTMKYSIVFLPMTLLKKFLSLSWVHYQDNHSGNPYLGIYEHTCRFFPPRVPVNTPPPPRPQKKTQTDFPFQVDSLSQFQNTKHFKQHRGGLVNDVNPGLESVGFNWLYSEPFLSLGGWF